MIELSKKFIAFMLQFYLFFLKKIFLNFPKNALINTNTCHYLIGLGYECTVLIPKPKEIPTCTDYYNTLDIYT